MMRRALRWAALYGMVTFPGWWLYGRRRLQSTDDVRAWVAWASE